MSDPKGMLVWMTLFVAAIAGVGALLYTPMRSAFEANVIFNGFIVGVFAAGVVLNFLQVAGLRPAARWIDRTDRGFAVRNPPRLVATLARMLAGRAQQGFAMSTLAMRSLLDGVRLRLDESRDVSRYFVGLLVFLGLLGTFWGLLVTIGGVGRVIGGLNAGADAASFASFKESLQGPLAGMGTAFSSSLFGLAGALALGVLDLQAGHAQNRFYGGLEEFLASRAQLPGRGVGAEGEPALPSYIEALLESTSENLAQIERMMTRGEEDRRSAQAGLAALTDRLTELSDQLRTEQKLVMTLARNQHDLQPAMAELASQVSRALAGNDEVRAHLRNVDVAVSRLLDEVAGAREKLPEAMRQEVRVLAHSLAQRPRGQG